MGCKLIIGIALVRLILSELFEDHIIANHSDLNSSTRSPDLSPDDFFLWGYFNQHLDQGLEFDVLGIVEEKLLESVPPYQGKFS